MEGPPILRTLWFARLVAFPILGGLLLFVFLDAPAQYAAVNAGAFGLGLIAIHFCRLPASMRAKRALSTILVLVLALPLVMGPQVEGIARWLTVGPIRLNTGLLVVPLLAVVAVRDYQWGWAFLVAGLVFATMQPDAGATLALSLALLVWAYVDWNWRALTATALGIAATLYAFAAGALPPVRLVEGLVPMLWAELERPLQAIGLTALLALPLIYFLTEKRLLRQDALMLAATYTGFLGMSFLGPYPVPLAGYGAASILGFMAAIAATPRHEKATAIELLTMANLVGREDRLLGRPPRR